MADLAVLSALAEMHRRQARLEAKLDRLIEALAEDAEDDDRTIRCETLDGQVIDVEGGAESLDG